MSSNACWDARLVFWTSSQEGGQGFKGMSSSLTHRGAEAERPTGRPAEGIPSSESVEQKCILGRKGREGKGRAVCLLFQISTSLTVSHDSPCSSLHLPPQGLRFSGRRCAPNKGVSLAVHDFKINAHLHNYIYIYAFSRCFFTK